MGGGWVVVGSGNRNSNCHNCITNFTTTTATTMQLSPSPTTAHHHSPPFTTTHHHSPLLPPLTSTHHYSGGFECFYLIWGRQMQGVIANFITVKITTAGGGALRCYDRYRYVRCVSMDTGLPIIKSGLLLIGYWLSIIGFWMSIIGHGLVG